MRMGIGDPVNGANSPKVPKTPYQFLVELDREIEMMMMEFYSIIIINSSSPYVFFNLLRFFLNEKNWRILKCMTQLQAFTSLTIQESLSMSKGQVRRIIDFLVDTGFLMKHSLLKYGPGAPTTLYLLIGADESKLTEAKRLHMDLLPKGYVRSLEIYIDQAKLELIIKKTEVSARKKRNIVYKEDVVKAIREEEGGYNHDLYQSTIAHFRKNKWRVIT